MAGIIGQLTANARKRKDAKTVNSDKCMYHLQEFDRHGFDPSTHNKYVRHRQRMEAEIDRSQAEYLENCELGSVCFYATYIYYYKHIYFLGISSR